MLNKATNNEKKITMVLLGIIGIFFIYLIMDKSIIDIVYLFVGIYYFLKFLFIKNRR